MTTKKKYDNIIIENKTTQKKREVKEMEIKRTRMEIDLTKTMVTKDLIQKHNLLDREFTRKEFDAIFKHSGAWGFDTLTHTREGVIEKVREEYFPVELEETTIMGKRYYYKISNEHYKKFVEETSATMDVLGEFGSILEMLEETLERYENLYKMVAKDLGM